MLSRLALSTLAPMFMATSLYAADNAPKAEAAPGTCFVYKVDEETGVEKDPASTIVGRVDLQPLQFKVEGKPLPETRFRIAIQPRGESGLIADDISAACTGEKLAFTCNLRCGDKVVGKFKAEALPTKPAEPKADYLRLTFEEPTVLNGCSEGKKPYTVPETLKQLQIILKGAEKTACFK